MDLVKRLEEYRDRERELMWEGTFAQYFEIASKRPEVEQLSHERIYRMIMDAGVETTRTGEPRYTFFSQEIFGIEKPCQSIHLIVSKGGQVARAVGLRIQMTATPLILRVGTIGIGDSDWAI